MEGDGFEPLVPRCEQLLFLTGTGAEADLKSVVCCGDQVFESRFLQRRVGRKESHT